LNDIDSLALIALPFDTTLILPETNFKFFLLLIPSSKLALTLRVPLPLKVRLLLMKIQAFGDLLLFSVSSASSAASSVEASSG